MLGALASAHDDVTSPTVPDKSRSTKIKDAAANKEGPKSTPAKLGLLLNDSRALQGYTLLAPMDSTNTYLLDMEGKVVHTWKSDYVPALCPLLLDNGHLLRPGSIGMDCLVFGPGPGVGGRIQEFTWEGKLVWDFKFYNSRQLPHHDITRLPNGNVLLIVSDRKTAEEAIAAGRRPELTGDKHLIPDSLVEIKPTGPTSGEVVWEWHLWDHLVQDFDKTKPNYGNVREHPELVNINFGEDDLKPPAPAKADPNKPQPAGKSATQPTPPRPPRANPDWTHFNGVAYNLELDQIIVSVYAFNEFWILDHSTTTAEAAGHSGGRSGKGGDLLYRWGNPHTYRAGTKADQKLFHQHNVHWIAKGLPGEGHLLLFNNGSGRQGDNYSSVEEFVLPVDSQGRYICKPGEAYGPDKPVWSYTAAKKTDFYSSFISGTQRLSNGNTLICSGANGTIFEVTPTKEIVWKYVNPSKRQGEGGPQTPGQLLSPIAGELLGISAVQRMQIDTLQKDITAHLDKLLTVDQKKHLVEKEKSTGNPVFIPPARPGQIMSSAQQDRLKLTDDQKKDLASLQKTVDEEFDKALTPAQRKQLKSVFAGFAGPPPSIPSRDGPGGSAQPGKIFSPSQQDKLKLSVEQKKRLEEMQKELDSRLALLLTQEQKNQLRSMQQSAFAAAGGPNRSGPPGGTPVFRAYRFSINHPAFAGKKWSPGKSLEELQEKKSGKKAAQTKS
jgi:hypothetical protein